jgi:DNA replication regulator DPB11
VSAVTDATTSADFHTPPTQPLTSRSSALPQRIISEPTEIVMPVQSPHPPRAPSLPAPALQAENSMLARDKQAKDLAIEARLAEREALNSKITSLIHSATVTPTDDGTKSFPRPRRRQILGRAISNASNASSGTSADVGKSALDTIRSEIADSEDDEAAPPGTQLGYVDTEAQQLKAALMSRMMGENGEVKNIEAPEARKPAEVVDTGGGRTLRRR